MKKYVVSLLIGLTLLGKISYHKLHNPPAIKNSDCNDSLWKFIYHPQRLKIIEKCKTITGTLISKKKEADGDWHLLVDLDKPYQNLLAKANCDYQKCALVVEPICINKITQINAMLPCKGYNGPKFDIPSLGTKVKITGDYVEDLQHHSWRELHPIYRFDIIK